MKNIILLACIITLTSCLRVVFDVPQPRGVAPLTAFPANYQGIYVHEDESRDSMIIGSNTVTITEFSDRQIDMDALDTTPEITLKDGLLYDADLPEVGGIPYTVEDNVLHYSYSERHTLGLSDSLVIKQAGSRMVVSANFDDSDEYWDVYLTKITNSGDLQLLSVGNLRTPDSDQDTGNYDGNLEDFNKITPYEKVDENTYLFKPTKHEFLKLVKKGLFSNRDTYHRLQ